MVSSWKPKETVSPEIKYISTYKIYYILTNDSQLNTITLIQRQRNTVKALSFTGLHALMLTTPYA